MTVALIAWHVFKDGARSRTLVSLIGFAVALFGASLLLAQLSAGQDLKIIKDIGLSVIELSGVLMAVLLGVGLVAKEIERRSIYALLARPIRDARDGIDLDPRHPGRVHEQRTRERRARAVPRPLHRDVQADEPRVLDDRDDVLDGLGERDGCRSLVDCEVPRPSRVVPARVPGEEQDVRGGRGAGRVAGVEKVSHTSISPVVSGSCPERGCRLRRNRCGCPHPKRGADRRFFPSVSAA